MYWWTVVERSGRNHFADILFNFLYLCESPQLVHHYFMSSSSASPWSLHHQQLILPTSLNPPFPLSAKCLRKISINFNGICFEVGAHDARFEYCTMNRRQWVAYFRNVAFSAPNKSALCYFVGWGKYQCGVYPPPIHTRMGTKYACVFIVQPLTYSPN